MSAYIEVISNHVEKAREATTNALNAMKDRPETSVYQTFYQRMWVALEIIENMGEELDTNAYNDDGAD